MGIGVVEEDGGKVKEERGGYAEDSREKICLG